MSFPDYKGKTVGFAKVMGELPVSDGELAYEIVGFTATEEGFLESKSLNMPLIPYEWLQPVSLSVTVVGVTGVHESVASGKAPTSTYDAVVSSVENIPEFENVYAMKFIEMNGETPDLLILSSLGVFRFSPSYRDSVFRSPLGCTDKYNFSHSSEYASPGLAEQYLFKSKILVKSGSGGEQYLSRRLTSIIPQSKPMFPAQMETVGNRIYFTYCDGGGAYVWDGHRVREFGYQSSPSPPYVLGPTSNKLAAGDSGWNNGGGFSDGGRIGTINPSLTNITEDDIVVSCGGIEDGLWYYAVVFENQDGSYSATSERSSRVSIQFHVTHPESERTRWGLGFLRRRFWLSSIPKGPQGTVARILLRTSNLSSLPPGDTGELRFLHRIPNNSAQQYMDDIPDSELGGVWEDRRNAPPGFYFMKYFGGSMFVMRTEDHPSRIWWSEQGTVTGSIPESFMQNSWRDIFPETGSITGAYSASIDGKQTLLVFKDSATHFVSDSYEQPGTSGWSFGTLSTIAGAAGPNLCQSTPDGSVIWYGNGTFWMWGKETPGVIDIGSPIRKKLSKINGDAERFGVSWVTKKNKEIVFCLPFEDSNVPNVQFIWDYRNRGWRIRGDIQPTAVETIGDLTLVANNTSEDRWGTQRIYSYSSNILVYQRGYASKKNTQWLYGYYPSKVYWYKSGWQSFSEFGPEFHSTHRTADSVFTMQERSLTMPEVKTYSDWNFDWPVNEESIYSVNPEQADKIAFWDGSDAGIVLTYGSGGLFSELDDPTRGFYGPDPYWYSTGRYSNSTFRERRTFTHRLPLDVPSSTVFSVTVSGSLGVNVALISVDAYGPESSGPTSRSPAAYEG